MTALININENSVPVLNMLNQRCGGRVNTKEECRCISIMVSSEKNGWAK